MYGYFSAQPAIRAADLLCQYEFSLAGSLQAIAIPLVIDENFPRPRKNLIAAVSLRHYLRLLTLIWHLLLLRLVTIAHHCSLHFVIDTHRRVPKFRRITSCHLSRQKLSRLTTKTY